MPLVAGTGFRRLSTYDNGSFGINFDEVVAYFHNSDNGLVLLFRGGGELIVPEKWSSRVLEEAMLIDED